MFMVYPQSKSHMISINVSLPAAVKLEDKCGFHFSIMLILPEERIIFKSLKLKKDRLHVLLYYNNNNHHHRTLKIAKLGLSLMA
jgi:hypothetical protein